MNWRARGSRSKRDPRPIEIERFSLQFGQRPDEVDFEVKCSKGTFVRVLAAEVGRVLGTVATLASLRRTEFGLYRLEESTSLEALLDREPGDLPVLDLRAALRGVREIPVRKHTAFGIAAGQVPALEDLPLPNAEDELAGVIAPNGGLLAVVEARGAGWAIRRVVMPDACVLYRATDRC